MSSSTEADWRRRFAAARVAHLATADARGVPHLVPVTFAVEGEVIWTAVDHKPKRTRALKRLANIETNPRVALLVDHYSDDDWSALWWVRADGTARVIERPPPAALAALGARYGQYAERPPEGPAIAVTVERWSGWSAAG
jgi:PPOX class probable F420-dependent enzyme